jgi:DnaJ-domain-containing protein 1
MDSMYDKLGDLLSSALESGEIPRKKDSAASASAAAEEEIPPSVHNGTRTKITRILSGEKKLRKGEIIHSYNTAAVFPDYVARSYAVLEIETDASEDEIRNAYRAKLKIFHPDMNSSNETIQKIAKQKTSEIIKAYEILTEWKFHKKGGQDKIMGT